MSALDYQPVGYYEYSRLYASWRVYASKITVKYIQSGYPPTPQAIGVWYSNSLTIPGYPLNAMYVDPAWKWKNTKDIFVFLNGGGTAEVHSNVGQIKHYASTKKIFATRDVTDEEFEGLTAANPPTQWYWHVCKGNPWDLNVLSPTPAEVTFRVFITYYVEFFNRVNLNKSEPP